MKFRIYIAAVCRALVFSIFIFSCYAKAEYEAGHEYDVVVSEPHGRMKVYLPANYEPSKRWPLVVFYHGMNGSPTTDCVTRHCHGNDFIVAGVTYCEKLPSKLTREEHNAYIERERRNFRCAVKWVKTNLSLDIKRVFLGGISKGGWATSFIGERELNNLAGFFILLAGRQRGAVTGPQKMNGFPIFIGAGETDPNITSAAQASAFYRHCGASVTFEEFEGLGHQVPQNGEKFFHWLEAYGVLSHPWLAAEVREKHKEAFKKRYQSAVSLDDNSKICLELKSLVNDPRLTVVCGDRTRSAMQNKLINLSKNTVDCSNALAAENMFYNAAWNEWQMKTIDDISEVVESYQKIIKAAPGSRWAVYAENSRNRLLPTYQSAQKQLRSMQLKRKSTSPGGSRSSFGKSGGMGGTSLGL